MARKPTALLLLAAGVALPAYAGGIKEESASGNGRPTHVIAAQLSDAPEASVTVRPVVAPGGAVAGGFAKQLEGAKAASGVAAFSLASLRSFPEQTGRTSGNWGGVLTDIARHLPNDRTNQDAFAKYTQAGDLVTAGHEWTHFLNAYLSCRSGVGMSCYYLLSNRYVVLRIPEGMRGIVPNVPASMRSELYDLYCVQNSSNARVDPLYLFDEWTAYTNDVTVAVDQLDNGKPLNPFESRAIQPQTAGNVLEFMFYGFAVGMTVKAYDPGYYASPEGQKLREFIRWNAQRSLEAYGKALLREEISHGDSRHASLMRNFRNSADTAEMRTWVRKDLGEDFANRLLNSSRPAPTRNVTQAQGTYKRAT